MDPLYTPGNTTAAYQLRWSLALFPKRELPGVDQWLSALQTLVERDGVRILETTRSAKGAQQLLLSTRPDVAPQSIVKSVKGRLQNLLRPAAPDAFQRNFMLTSLGDVSRDAVERYVAGQLQHHRMADEQVQRKLEEFQLDFPEIDLADPQASAHGCYLCNLHLVLVHESRWHEIAKGSLEITRDMVLRVAKKKGHRLSRASILTDHLHLTLGFSWTESPQDVALSYLNNLAFAHGMRALYMPSYYVGTFGEYDMGAVRHALEASAAVP